MAGRLLQWALTRVPSPGCKHFLLCSVKGICLGGVHVSWGEGYHYSLILQMDKLRP